MLYRFIYNKSSLSWVISLFMFLTSTAMAGGTITSSNNSQYKLHLAGQSNPWALPEKPDRHSDSQQMPQYYQQDHQERRQQEQQNKVWRNSTERFVTPKFLESLKQQQKQYQVMPENQRYQQHQPRRYMQMQPESGLHRKGDSQGAYGYPLYGTGGTGSANPLYDAPAVSPWGEGPDVLYRGQSLPLVPSEAIGGFSPMHVPEFGMNNFKNTDANEPAEVYEHKVFNPFTFLPDSGLR